jgi:hypothetical protein
MMSQKNSEIKRWTDPKDYGLPYVDIIPILSKMTSEVSSGEKEKIEDETIPVQDSKNPKSVSEPIGEFNQIPLDSEVVEPEEKAVKKDPKPAEIEIKKSRSWVYVVIILALASVGVIIWQLQKQGNLSNPVAGGESQKVSSKMETPEVLESTATGQNQVAVNQDSIGVINNSNPDISKPAETGTTIANTVSGKLVRIESKAERGRFFIVVASLPNEGLALNVADQFAGKSSELYLITPYESSPNYRVAIGKFETWNAASEEVTRIKSTYQEQLWILKY